MGATFIGGRSHVQDCFNLVVFIFAFDNVWGWSGVVGAVLFSFCVRGKKRIVEDQVDLPGLGQLEAGVGVITREDLEGSVAAGCEFGFRVGRLDISSFQPY